MVGGGVGSQGPESRLIGRFDACAVRSGVSLQREPLELPPPHPRLPLAQAPKKGGSAAETQGLLTLCCRTPRGGCAWCPGPPPGRAGGRGAEPGALTLGRIQCCHPVLLFVLWDLHHGRPGPGAPAWGFRAAGMEGGGRTKPWTELRHLGSNPNSPSFQLSNLE